MPSLVSQALRFVSKRQLTAGSARMLIDEVGDVPYFRMNRYPAIRLRVVFAKSIERDQRPSHRLVFVPHIRNFLHVAHGC